MSVRRYAITAPRPATESERRFACFGGTCAVVVADATRPAEAAAAAATAERKLLEWHRRFSRFQDDSELSRLNRDERAEVPVSPLMGRVIAAAMRAARDTGGLVDAALGGEIERAGYASDRPGPGIALDSALALAPAREPASGASSDRWSQIVLDQRALTVTRPPGTRLDPGGIAKGVFADVLAALLEGFDAFAIDCAGDLRLGGRAGRPRDVHVLSPFDGRLMHTFPRRSGGVATSGIGRRSWITPGGRPAHHLLDPSTGRPAFTGVVQATALAPTTTEAEVLAKAAILGGPGAARRWLRHGGIVVLDDGDYELIEPAATRCAPADREIGRAQMSSSTRGSCVLRRPRDDDGVFMR